jgi:hypothetical protein
MEQGALWWYVRFVLCCRRHKARNASNSVGVIPHYRQDDAKCLITDLDAQKGGLFHIVAD